MQIALMKLDKYYINFGCQKKLLFNFLNYYFRKVRVDVMSANVYLTKKLRKPKSKLRLLLQIRLLKFMGKFVRKIRMEAKLAFRQAQFNTEQKQVRFTFFKFSVCIALLND